jgi:hypothetical protein
VIVETNKSLNTSARETLENIGEFVDLYLYIDYEDVCAIENMLHKARERKAKYIAKMRLVREIMHKPFINFADESGARPTDQDCRNQIEEMIDQIVEWANEE